jgi:tRNA pseudouridine65 synthase
MSDREFAELPVVYRDKNLIAVVKPSGMAVHRGWSDDAITAADVVRDQIIGAPVHALHRLDRATSGVLLFALDSATAKVLSLQFESCSVSKRYLALVRGPMNEPCILDHPVPRRDGCHRVDAHTEFQPLGHIDRWSLVEARPRTGRLHQIRRHLKHLSHPIVGDVRYGKGDINRMFREEFGLHRLALHAFELGINHDDRLLVLRAPLPPDLYEPMTKLGILNEVASTALSSFLPTSP